MSERIENVVSYYSYVDEDSRLKKSRHGQMEYITTMEYIHQHASKGDKILEIGAGTGRYSIALAKEGFDVTAVELVEHNLNILRDNSAGLENLHSHQGDALCLSEFKDGEFDLTLVLGPMYHLYDKNDVDKAINEAIRVTKKSGVILVAFLSVYAVLFNNYLNGNLIGGIEKNFNNEYLVKHSEEQFFTGYDITEFERLFEKKRC